MESFEPLEREPDLTSSMYVLPSNCSTSDTFILDFLDSVLENLSNVVNLKADLIVPIKKQIEVFEDNLRFLKNFVQFTGKCSMGQKKVEDLLSRIKDVTIEAADFILLLDETEMEDGKVEEISLMLENLLEQMKFEEVTKIYVKLLMSSRSSLSMTDGIGFIHFLLENLKELLSCKADLVASLRHQIEAVQKELDLLTKCLGNNSVCNNENGNLKNLWIRILNVAYQAEYVIDSYVIKDGPVWCHAQGLSDVIEEIKLIKMEISDKKHDLEVQDVAKTFSVVSSHATAMEVDEFVVGFDDEASMIIDNLIGGSPSQLDIVSIVGMPGLGKTTLARKVYKEVAESEFHARAWCVISQVYKKRELLLEILRQTTNVTGKINEKDDGDLADMLYKSLKGRRYLIVMDDIWEIKAWNDLKESFPDDNNGSRIMFTSRRDDLPLKAKNNGKCHHLRSLRKDESWDLLRRKLFHSKGCPAELVQVGKQIAESCQGLPLAIVVIAGLLARTEKEEGWWKEVAINLSSHVTSDQERFMDIVGLSYKHLPDHLKPCFLYFGAFLEDEEIPVRKLIYLWMAEGFVQKTGLENLEDVGQGYLMDLIFSNLILVAKKTSRNGVKSCSVHDLLRDFCVAKAEEENFWQMIHGYDEDGWNSSSTYNVRRLCIYSKSNHCTGSMPSGPRVRTLLFFASSEVYLLFFPYAPIAYDFKLLRVLDMGCFSLGHSFPREIELLVHLRYLAVRGFLRSLPPTISKLWNLETLILHGLSGKVELPDTLWNMGRLRHVCLKNGTALRLNKYRLEDNFKLYNLQTLSAPYLSGRRDTMIVKSIPSIRRLKCTFLEAWDPVGCCNQFPELDSLNELESLNASYCGQVLSPCKFSLPSNLKKLTLSDFCLPWSEISTIVELPNLEVLKLQSKAFDGEQWELGDQEFCSLKYLKLDSLNIQKWDASPDNFPALRHLVLQRCNQLAEIPPSFGDSNTLQVIEVQWCSHTTAKSAKDIQNIQVEAGYDKFEVFIHI